VQPSVELRPRRSRRRAYSSLRERVASSVPVRALLTALLGIAALLAIRLALAEALFRQDSDSTVRRALSIQGTLPGFAHTESSRYYERLAALDPAQARAALARAVQVDSRSSRAWIQLGLAQEQSGNLVEAERALLRAADADRQYLPAWTLANFYFRRIYFQHASADVFWRWARSAAGLGNAGLAPLLRLCDRVKPDRFPERLGETPALDRAYLDFFIRADRLGSAQPSAIHLAKLRNPADAPRLVDFADRQIRDGNGAAAVEVWNALSAANLIPFRQPDPVQPLTNGDLKTAPSGHGFDWRLPQAEGVSTEWEAGPAKGKLANLRFSFSGSEAEACRLLDQSLLLGARRYRLRFEYFAAGMPSPAGIRWMVESSGTTGDRTGIFAESPPVPIRDAGYSAQSSAQAPAQLPYAWTGAEWTFSFAHSNAPSILARIALIYRREPGTTRAAGRFAIRNLRLEAL
jgi:tetratricopeptide (TPR) repeat protein